MDTLAATGATTGATTGASMRPPPGAKLGPLPGITRIAHLSDSHILDPRPSRTRSGWSMRTRFLSIGRPLDAEGRREKLRRSLETAQRVGAEHFVLSGDLTEIGAPGEYEALAEVLHDSGIEPDRMTLVPGNHDVYSSADAWQWALKGPLAAFARTSAREPGPGRIVEIAGARLLPLDATFHQPVTRSAGWMTDQAIESNRAPRDGHVALAPAPRRGPAPPAVSPQDQRAALARRPRRRQPDDGPAREVPAPLGPPRSPARHRQSGPRLRGVAHPRRDRRGRRPRRSARARLRHSRRTARGRRPRRRLSLDRQLAPGSVVLPPGDRARRYSRSFRITGYAGSPVTRTKPQLSKSRCVPTHASSSCRRPGARPVSPRG